MPYTRSAHCLKRETTIFAAAKAQHVAEMASAVVDLMPWAHLDKMRGPVPCIRLMLAGSNYARSSR